MIKINTLSNIVLPSLITMHARNKKKDWSLVYVNTRLTMIFNDSLRLSVLYIIYQCYYDNE